MGPFTFTGVCYFHVVGGGNLLSPQGSNHALGVGQGNPQDPANCYNVYSTLNSGEYIYQSQLNGMYWGKPAGADLVCASIADPAQSQPLIPTPYTKVTPGGTILWLPDKVNFLGVGVSGCTFMTFEGPDINAFVSGGVRPTSWSFSELKTGKGTRGFTLQYADLTDSCFTSGFDFTDINFSGAIFDGATLSRCNLTRTNFTNCSFKNASFEIENPKGWTIFDKANFTGAQFRFTTLGHVKSDAATFDEAEFMKTVFRESKFAGASFNKTIFKESLIIGGDFSNCDLSTAVFEDFFTNSSQSQPINFSRSKFNFHLIKYNWQWMDLRKATIDQLPHALSSASNPLNAVGAKLSGLNQNSFRGLTLEHAVFDYAMLDKLDLSRADLTGASLIQASLHGATLTDAKLQDANLTGAQLGSLGQRFTLSTSFETDLNAGPNVDAALRDLFKQNNITLSSTASLEILAAGRVWELNDAGNKVTYSIRLESGAHVLTVYAPAAAASLVNAYMPNAVLTGANLYNVLANGIQFYGGKARIDGSAILEEAELNNSNLSNLNLTQAQLMGTNLSHSYLFNAKFNKANLTPSATGKATDLGDANLQGVDFTDAQLFGANLANAAVAINIPTKGNPDQGGVYLFSLPYAGDKNSLQQYIAELDAAAKQFSLNPNGDAATLQKYVTALETNQLKTLKGPFTLHHFTLSDSAQIQTIALGSVWQIVDGQNSYTLWTDIDETGATELYAAPSLTKTREAFHQSDITLRWQAGAAIDKEDQQWLLDNDSENPNNFSTGYIKFLLKLDGSVLDVYGTALRITRLGKDNQNEYDTENCNVTKLTLANMNGDTVCPNGAKLTTNQNTSGVQWDTKWLRASTPPKPPTCVPTGNSWCPTNSASSDALRAQAGGAD